MLSYKGVFFVLIMGTIIFGMIRMFKKQVPMYFMLYVCGVWCYAIGLIYVFLIGFCGETYSEINSLGPLATGGMFAFFASANYGAFNSLMDDRSKKNNLIRVVSLVAALLVVAIIFLETVQTKGLTVINTVMLSIEQLPIPFCVYFCVKFLLMKSDGDKMLMGVKPLNLCTLLICFGMLAYDYFMILGNDIAMNITFCIYSACIVAEIFLADWGRKKWQS